MAVIEPKGINVSDLKELYGNYYMLKPPILPKIFAWIIGILIFVTLALILHILRPSILGVIGLLLSLIIMVFLSAYSGYIVYKRGLFYYVSRGSLELILTYIITHATYPAIIKLFRSIPHGRLDRLKNELANASQDVEELTSYLKQASVPLSKEDIRDHIRRRIESIVSAMFKAVYQRLINEYERYSIDGISCFTENWKLSIENVDVVRANIFKFYRRGYIGYWGYLIFYPRKVKF